MSLFTAVEMAPRDPILGLNEQFARRRQSQQGQPRRRRVLRRQRQAAAAAVRAGRGRRHDEGAQRRAATCRSTASPPTTTPSRAWSSAPTANRVKSRPRRHHPGHRRHRRPEGRRRLPQEAQPRGQGADQRPELGKPPRAVHQRRLRGRKLPYYDAAKRGINFDGMLAALNAAPAGTIVVLHACCHNPTGYDITPAQWDQVIAAVKAERA